jgi:hypothetical protein
MQAGALGSLFQGVGLRNVTVRAIDIDTHFHGFEDYWSPFLGGRGPAPGYTLMLSEDHRATLRNLLQANLPIAADGSIKLLARAWAVRGTVLSSPGPEGSHREWRCVRL